MDIKRLIRNFDQYFSAFCLAVMLFTIFLQVLLRVAFDAPLLNVEEFVRFLLIWTILFPLAYTLRDGGHIGMTEIRDLLPLPIKKFLEWLSDISSVIIFGIITYSSALVIIHNPTNKTATLLMPFWLFFLPNLLGFLMLTLGYILVIRNRITSSTTATRN